MAEPLRVVDPSSGELVSPGCRSCHELSAKAAGLEGDLEALQGENLRLIRANKALKRDREAERQRSRQRVVIERLHEFWQVETGKRKSPLGPTRFDALERALRTYTPEQIQMAIVGAATFPYYRDFKRSRDGSGTRYVSIEHVCKEQERFEMLAVLGAREMARREEQG